METQIVAHADSLLIKDGDKTRHNTEKKRENQMKSRGLMNERGRGSATLMTVAPSNDETEVSTATEPSTKDKTKLS
jgi:hypothetical protein